MKLFKRLPSLTAALLIAGGAVAITSVPASAAPSPSHALGHYSSDFQAQVVEIDSMDNLNQTDRIVQVMHLSPFAMRSLGQCGQYVYCAWTSTSYGGSVYAWNTAWNNTCVPVGGAFDNNAESFANHMGPHTWHGGSTYEGWWAELNSTSNCGISGGMEGLHAQEDDSNLSPWNNILSSFQTFYCGPRSGC